MRQRIEILLSWAAVGGYRGSENPVRWRGNLEHVLAKPSKVRKTGPFAALPWATVPAFMREIRQHEGVGARALEFAILAATRSGEVRGATWDEIDCGRRLWTITGERMKAGKTHRVPLSPPAMAVLQNLPRFVGTPHVFAAVRGGQLSDMSVSAVMRRMGATAVPHGFRSSFKHWARHKSQLPDEVSELSLAHVNSDATRVAYARDELLAPRRQQLAAWATFLGSGRKSAP